MRIVHPPAARQIVEGNYRVVNKDDSPPKEDVKPDNSTATTTTTSETTTDNKSGGEPSGGHNEIIPTPAPVMNVAAVDVAPSFPGGEKEMMKFLQNNLKYSATAREDRISGKVYASFITDESGNITEVQIQKGLEQSLDAEVLRVINKMPQWTPGIYHGRPVKVIFMLAVTFSLLN